MDTLALTTMVAVLLFMATGLTGPVSSLYVESLGASYAKIGLLGTVTSLTAIVFSYVWGRVSDRLGRRKVLLVCSLAILAASYALTAAARHYGQLFPVRILAAVAQAGYGTSSLALIGDLLEQSGQARGRRMGIFRGLCSLGFGVMAFVSGTVADAMTLRAPFVISGMLCVIASLLALRIDESPPRLVPEATAPLHGEEGTPDGDAGSSPSPRVALSPLPLTPLLVSVLLWSLVTGAVYAVWANYMVGELGYSRAAMSRLWAVASLSEFPLMILAGWLSDRWGRLPVLGIGFVAWTLVFLGYVTVPILPWIVVVQLIRGFAYSAFTATAMAYAAEVRARSQRGATSGLYNASGGVGTILGSSLGGFMAEFTSFTTMISANAVLVFGAAVYVLSVSVWRKLRGGRS